MKTKSIFILAMLAGCGTGCVSMRQYKADMEQINKNFVQINKNFQNQTDAEYRRQQSSPYE